MLILTRRVGETLMIGDDVTVTVLEVKGNQVRIGVNAPREVAVHREEIMIVFSVAEATKKTILQMMLKLSRPHRLACIARHAA